MSNTWYNVTGAPGSQSFLSSAQIRAEFELIQTAFNTMPTVTRMTSGALNAATTTGSANAYIASIATVTAYEDLQRYTLKINVVNTGASTVNISSLGTRTIKRLDGSDVEAGDLGTNKIYDFVYNATTGTIVLLNMMPESVQSDSPTFSTVTATTINGTTGTITTLDGTTLTFVNGILTTAVRAPAFNTTIVAVTISGGVATINWALGSVFEIDVTGNFTITFTNFPTTTGRAITIIFSNTGAYNVTGMTASGMTIYRPDDVVLTLTSGSGKKDAYTVLVYKSNAILVFPVKNFVTI